MSARLCQIVAASLENASGAGDGAYDLHDVTGTPETIGKAIVESLQTGDLYSSRRPSAIGAGEDLYLCLKIKFCEPR
jgi:hypothetical protein